MNVWRVQGGGGRRRRIFVNVKKFYKMGKKIHTVSSAYQTLTCDTQHHCLTVNVQLWRWGTNITLFYKINDSIRELIYRKNKYQIEIKVKDQKCNLIKRELRINIWIKILSHKIFKILSRLYPIWTQSFYLYIYIYIYIYI